MTPLPRPAQYLLRIDDICPTVHRESWDALVSMIREFAIHPILAVVPENGDPHLRQSPPAPWLWPVLRALEADGSAIGLHGYRHVCTSLGGSMVPIHRESEFAGQPETVQRERIRAGLEILRGKGLSPKLWVAPRHGFDRKTLSALRAEGITTLSDGMARVPYCRAGMTWIPQQLWAPVRKDTGLWTICLHPGAPLLAQLDEIRAFFSRHREQFTSFRRIQQELRAAPLTPRERLYESASMLRLRLRQARKHWLSTRRG